MTINGKTISAEPGKTILEVCREQKLDNIPTLCYDEKLPPFGSCFLCVVEIEGIEKLFPSCSTTVVEGMKILTRSEKVKRSRKTCLELLLSDHYADCFGPCRLTCPADVDIQGYMSLLNLGKFSDAVALIKETNPLPSVCGRVCTRKCEINCRRAMTGEAVGIDFLKRYATDQDMVGTMWQPDKKPDNGIPIAIIGGGPAGLTAAYYLVIGGYRPTIYEAQPKLGGMLRYGIPEYRLPRDVLQKEIDWITNLGVEVKTNSRLGRDFSIDDLFNNGFQAVFVGLGAQAGKEMRVTNEDAEGVLSGVEFLGQVEKKTAPKLKGHVVVVGGGNTAIDAARTSLRWGADKVTLLYRRTQKEMPANEMEIEAAIEEGVDMQFLAAPASINANSDKRVETLSCFRMELGEPDDSGRRRPVKIEGSDFILECDWIISAIGQEPDLDGLNDDSNIKTTKWNTIEANEQTFQTDREGVFSGGDVLTGPADAIDAIAAGHTAAIAIDKYINTGTAKGLDYRFESKRDNFHKLQKEDIPAGFQHERYKMPEMDPKERIKNFDEVELGFTEEMAKTEALRCVECGCDVGLACILQDYCSEYNVDQTRFVGEFNRYKVDTRHPFIKIDSNKCIRCSRCISVCSEILNVSALGFVNRGFRTIVKPALDKALQETNCVSCGNCIDVCPTGALVEKMPYSRSGPWKMDSVSNVCNYCSVGCKVIAKVLTSDVFYVVGANISDSPNFGELCVRGRFGYQQYLDGSRVSKPMVRKSGKLVEVSWDEAFKAVQDGLARIRQDHSPDSILVSASPKLTDEELYLTGRMARTGLKTNNLISFQQFSSGADYHALDEMLGITSATVNSKELAEADLYLFLGGNPTLENPVMGWQLKRRMKQGVKSIVINSAAIDLTDHATIWADARRGTATSLLNGVISHLIADNHIDNKYLDSKTINSSQVIKKLSQLDIEEVSTICGVKTKSIKKIADLLSHPNQKIVAWYNLDSRVERASNELQALTTLLLLLGKIGNGSGLALTSSQCNHSGMRLAGFGSRIIPGGSTIKNEEMLKNVSTFWQTDLKELTASEKEPLTRKIREDKLRSAFILGENPAAAPELNNFVDNLEFLVVGDLYMTETAQRADVFLPLSNYLETQGHLTNWAGERQQTTPIGEVQSGFETRDIILKLAEITGNAIPLNSYESVKGELNQLIKLSKETVNGDFATPDGKAHFVLYSDRVDRISAELPQVIETDARMASRMDSIRA